MAQISSVWHEILTVKNLQPIFRLEVPTSQMIDLPTVISKVRYFGFLFEFEEN